ncbi:MAG: NADPH-dependent FMN reductase [Ginsengibacter sp.]
MENRRKILAISGSTRQNSTNHRLIKAITEISTNIFDIQFYNGVALLPHFNPDNDDENVPQEVTHFRQLLNEADGVIICTPEYAHGVPGSLKNAIDWTVGTSEFSHKPTILITASTDGKYGHASLLETLRVIEAENIDAMQLLISFASTKVSKYNKIIDIQTLEDIKLILEKFEKTINGNCQEMNHESDQ